MPPVVAATFIVGVAGDESAITTELLVALGGETQVLFEVMMHCTTSLLLSEDELNVGLLVPVFVPFTVH